MLLMRAFRVTTVHCHENVEKIEIVRGRRK